MLFKSCMTVIASSLLACVSTAHGGQITNLQVYDGGGAPTATINYSGADGNGNLSANVYADPQVSDGTSVPLYYCVDLWHDNYIGSTYTITPVTTMAFSNSTFADVDNRIGWLLSQDQSTADRAPRCSSRSGIRSITSRAAARAASR